MAEDVRQRIRVELTRLYAAVNETACTSDVSLEDVQYFSSCLEQFHRHLLRLSENNFVSTECVRMFRNAFESLRDFQIETPAPVNSNQGMDTNEANSPGRPRLFLSKGQLEFLLSLKFNKTQMSRMLGISPRTIQRRMAEYNLSGTEYSDLTEEELDDYVKEVKRQFPTAGYRQILGILKSQGIIVREHDLRESAQRCDPIGTSLRWFATVERRRYNVSSPLALWHLDGNHKLIRWRMVVHGAVDGYSRLVVYLHCSNNNRAETVLQLFQTAINHYGIPSRLRTDKGGENVDVAMFMLQHPARGTERGSVITGSSTHNQRIERLWRDVWDGVLSLYYSLFYHLEDEGVLDPLNELDMHALHMVFLPRVNRHIEIWKEGWNNHHMRTAHGLSPMQQFVSGMLGIRGSDLLVSQEMTEQELRTYGVDWDGPIPQDSDCDDIVDVPGIQANTNWEQEQLIREHVDPLSESDCYGIDLYIHVRSILHSFGFQ